MKKHQQKQNNPATINTSNGEFQQRIADSSNLHPNIVENYVMISESKIRVCLLNNSKNLKERSSWQTPAGIFLTVLIVFLTSEFKSFIFPKETWQAIFVIGGAWSFVWTIYSFFNRPKATTIDEIVCQLMPIPTNTLTEKPAQKKK